MTKIYSVHDLQNIKGKRVLIRLDLNVPMYKGKILSTFRIDRSLPTLKLLQKRGAKLILLSHADHGLTLRPAAKYLAKKLSKTRFAGGGISAKSAMIEKLRPGEALLFENIFFEEGEKKNDLRFTMFLASLADYYVNEAFSESHRPYSSVVGVAKLLPNYAGLLFNEELEKLSSLLSPQKPFVALISGAKFGTKLPLIEKYLKPADAVFVGGALANNFFKAKGYEVGKSFVDDSEIISENNLKKVLLPIDVLTSAGRVTTPDDVRPDEKIMDAGPATLSVLISKIKKAKTVLLNGPLGAYEEGYGKSTEELLKSASKGQSKITVGGGDTVTIVGKMKLLKKFSFVSTGGGAMLEFLSAGTLPGIEALKRE